MKLKLKEDSAADADVAAAWSYLRMTTEAEKLTKEKGISKKNGEGSDPFHPSENESSFSKFIWRVIAGMTGMALLVGVFSAVPAANLEEAIAQAKDDPRKPEDYINFQPCYHQTAAPFDEFRFLPSSFLNILVGRGGATKKKPLDPQPFAFDAAFGDNMVLQHGSKAAIYGFLGPNCTGVKLDVYSEGEGGGDHRLVYTTDKALINATHQPFGKGWGVRPCNKHDCPGKYDMNPFNPWNEPLPKWKILLPQQKAGGNFTFSATCLTKKENNINDVSEEKGAIELDDDNDNDDDDKTTISITNVTFGDIWYCSGQSNMNLPLIHTFHRNETAKNILYKNKYSNIRIMAGSSARIPYGKGSWSPDKYGSSGGSNPWMTARQALLADDGKGVQNSRLFQVGAACWYFGQSLADMGIDIPIGLINTAIGGQRIQEFMDNTTIGTCHNRSGAGRPNEELWWEGQLFATQVLPFVDMTIRGWIWYQGENNMGEVKGNSQANVGYGCEMKTLIQGWRKIWSETPLTTDPLAPFGLVTLASSGSEGGPDMGAMRLAQTANYGVLPHDKDLPNTFLAQAYDLDDEWGPDIGRCFTNKCCEADKQHYDPKVCTNETLYKVCIDRPGGCTAATDTATFMGGIHPRSKKAVGDRLGIAAYNLVYGGKGPYTGPTLQGCSLEGKDILEIRFNSSLMRGDTLARPKITPTIFKPDRWHRPAGGSQLYVQINATQFCMEEALIYDGAGTKHPRYFCPSWAGGTKEQETTPIDKPYSAGWIELNFTLAPRTPNAIHVDLTPLNGSAPTAVRYAWGLVDCCDYTDQDLYVTHGCIATCPLQSSQSKLPANPFQARIVDGKCSCIAPQVCSDDGVASSLSGGAY
jgi:hypothetical protein